MNMSPMAASQIVGHAEALDTRLPRVARLLAEGRTDWRTVQLIITRSELVKGELMEQLDRSMAERIVSWQCWSRRRIIMQWTPQSASSTPEAAKERRVTADTAKTRRHREKSARIALTRRKLIAQRASNADSDKSIGVGAKRSTSASGATTCAGRSSSFGVAGPAPVRFVPGSTIRSRTSTSPPTGGRLRHYPPTVGDEPPF